MTYLDLIRDADRQLDNGLITIGEYEQMIEPMNREVQPTVEPEIIRCRDCDWWTKQKDSVQGRCELMQMYPTGWWYCGNARRRGGDSD